MLGNVPGALPDIVICFLSRRGEENPLHSLSTIINPHTAKGPGKCRAFCFLLRERRLFFDILFGLLAKDGGDDLG
jgi:hypothetical protein